MASETEKQIEQYLNSALHMIGNAQHKALRKIEEARKSVCPEAQIKLRLQLLKGLKEHRTPLRVEAYIGAVETVILRSKVQLTSVEYFRMLERCGLIREGRVAYDYNPDLVDAVIAVLS